MSYLPELDIASAGYVLFTPNGQEEADGIPSQRLGRVEWAFNRTRDRYIHLRGRFETRRIPLGCYTEAMFVGPRVATHARLCLPIPLLRLQMLWRVTVHLPWLLGILLTVSAAPQAHKPGHRTCEQRARQAVHAATRTAPIQNEQTENMFRRSGFLWLSDASNRSRRLSPEAERFQSLPSYFAAVRRVDASWQIEKLNTSKRKDAIDLYGVLARQHRTGVETTSSFKAFFSCSANGLIGLSIGTEINRK